MSGKSKKFYEALVEGAQSGLTDIALFRHVMHHCPKATSKKIVRASLLALGELRVEGCNHPPHNLCAGDQASSGAPRLRQTSRLWKRRRGRKHQSHRKRREPMARRGVRRPRRIIATKQLLNADQTAEAAACECRGR